MAGFPSTKKGNAKGEPASNPRPGIPLDKKTMLQLIQEANGNLTRVAEAMGTTRHAVRRRCDKDPELLEALETARERRVDLLEECVWDRAIQSKDTGLQCFLLKTQGRNRGYDQSEAQHTAKDIATAAFDFIVSKTKPSE